MKAQHTPGPWHVIPDYAWQGRHFLHDARFVATSQMVDVWENGEDNNPPKLWRFQREKDSIICTMPDAENQKANAKLIAAAPDLLESLKQCVERLSVIETQFPSPWIEKAQKAIAKATA